MVPVCVLCRCCDRLEIRDCAVSEHFKYFTTRFLSAALNVSDRDNKTFFITFSYPYELYPTCFGV